MKRLSSGHLITVGVFLLGYTAMSLFGRSGFLLTAISDGTGTGLWLIAILAMSWAAFRNHGRVRWFWILLATGAAAVCVNLGAWFCYDVILKRPLPDAFWADIPLFLQPVPVMAAAAMRPSSKQQGQKFHLAVLNSLILLLWWLFIYAFFIYPHEYILPNADSFNTYYYSIFLLEFEVLLGILGYLALSIPGAWRRVYWELLLASALYLVAFAWLNGALVRGEYYAGSFYDVPVYASICWFVLIAVRGRSLPTDQSVVNGFPLQFDVSGFLAALAVLSLPVIALCELSLNTPARSLLPFRVVVTLIGVFLMAICVFFRQMLLAQERELLLCESKQNLEQLKKAQAQLVQRERLAGIGQLVAGVAHEMNNPLTAVIGYSDLLVEEEEGKPRERLQKLGTEARRIKRILSNLASFAQPQGGERRALDVGALVRDSVMLCQHQLRSCGATVQMNFAPNLPRVAGNEGQLKQVFVNLFRNCAQALEQASEKTVVVDASAKDGRLVISIRDSGPGFVDVKRAFDPFYTTRPVGQGTGLGLSVCYGAVREHNGNIFVENLQPHGAAVTIELPVAAKSAPAEAKPNSAARLHEFVS
jgi:signal transduction histidine kinase